MFFATALMEYESIRSIGLKQPVAVIPNGVLARPLCAVNPKRNLESRRDAEHVALFLSRVHPKKGIFNLLHAWAIVAPQGWRLKIAGPDEVGHLAEVMALASELGIEQMVDYLGSVDGEAKSQTYLEANLFVLPTFSENFGVVVAEALAHGLPVITTYGAPWADLETYGCGWWIDIGIDALVISLREAMALSDQEREEMGARGRDYVRRYNWDDIAQQTIDVYRWLLGLRPQPDFVRTD
jgi:glycosyltransferase involved in cell wall biosynthesis